MRLWDGHEARRGAGLGPCHPNREVVQYQIQMNWTLNIRLWRRNMDPGVGFVVEDLCSFGVRLFQSGWGNVI